MLKTYAVCTQCKTEEEVTPPRTKPDVDLKRSGWYEMGEKSFCSVLCLYSYVKALCKTEARRVSRMKTRGRIA